MRSDLQNMTCSSILDRDRGSQTKTPDFNILSSIILGKNMAGEGTAKRIQDMRNVFVQVEDQFLALTCDGETALYPVIDLDKRETFAFLWDGHESDFGLTLILSGERCERHYFMCARREDVNSHPLLYFDTCQTGSKWLLKPVPDETVFIVVPDSFPDYCIANVDRTLCLVVMNEADRRNRVTPFDICRHPGTGIAVE